MGWTVLPTIFLRKLQFWGHLLTEHQLTMMPWQAEFPRSHTGIRVQTARFIDRGRHDRGRMPSAVSVTGEVYGR